MNQMNQPVTQTRPIDYIHTVQEALKYRKDDVSYTYLMGASGEAFRFFYNRTDPEAGMNTFFHNPLRATCRTLGYSFEVSYDDTYEAASERLRENTRAGKPALLPFDDSCPFLTKDDGPETFICQNGSRYQIKTADLHKEWHPSGGFLELGPHGYYQVVIGEREREPKDRDAALGTLRVARKMAESRRKIQGCAIGLAAYDELIAHLSGMLNRKRKLTEHNVSKVMKWSGQPLTQFIEARTAAVDYLQMIKEHLEDEEELEHLDDAMPMNTRSCRIAQSCSDGYCLHLRCVKLLRRMTKRKSDSAWDLSRIALMEAPKSRRHRPQKEVMSHFKPKCRAAIKVLRKNRRSGNKGN